MSLRRKSIRLLDHERRILVELYLNKWRIPVSQFKSRPEDTQAFVEEWNRLSQRNDTADEVVHYMRTQRKRSLWERLGSEHTPVPPKETFSAEETEILVEVYCENAALFGKGTDVLDHDDELARLITKIFAERTGRFVPPDQIKTKLTAIRKRGRLPKVQEPPPESEEGFQDIDKFSQ
jgi:hypothetical protein